MTPIENKQNVFISLVQTNYKYIINTT